jgi:hypothetical protein
MVTHWSQTGGIGSREGGAEDGEEIKEVNSCSLSSRRLFTTLALGPVLWSTERDKGQRERQDLRANVMKRRKTKRRRRRKRSLSLEGRPKLIESSDGRPLVLSRLRGVNRRRQRCRERE